MTKKYAGIIECGYDRHLSIHDLLGAMKKPIPLKFVQEPGVYFLLKGTDIDYVGKTSNLYNRFRKHKHHRLKHYHKVSFLKVPEMNHLDNIEHYYIQAFSPRLNTKGKL